MNDYREDLLDTKSTNTIAYRAVVLIRSSSINLVFSRKEVTEFLKDYN